MKRLLESCAVLAVFAIGLLGASSAIAATCNVGALPATLTEGIKVRPYSLKELATSPASQETCVFLENVSGAAIPSVSVDHQMEELGTGVPGPWALLSSSSINISGGVSVTCSTSGSVGTTAATFGTLAAGAATDICCFVWEEDGMGAGCGDLPFAGDLVRHTSGAGSVVLMPLLGYVPVGGTTCGLVSLELLIILPLVRLARRRVGS